MRETPAPANGLQFFGRSSSFATGSILLLGFLLRLWRASGTFLNLDEAMHFLAANKPSLGEAYRASLGLAHPPLMILILNVWRNLGTSEVVMRLPSVIAGTIFCWIFFRWITRLFGLVAAWTGFLLVSFLPPFVELSSEIRQYSLLLCFMIGAANVLEVALAEESAAKMSVFFVFLYLGMLTHFSAILFAAAIGIYSLWRLFGAELPRRIVAVWVAGQAGALGLFVYLYRTHIASLKDSSAAQHMQALLANSYFHSGRDHLLSFIFARTFGVLQYTFGQLVVGDIAGGLFVAAIVFLLNGNGTQGSGILSQGGIGGEIPRREVRTAASPTARQIGVLLALPFVINCFAALADLYPYGGTRHSAFLAPFAVAGVSFMIAKLTRQRLVPSLAVILLIAAVCQIFGTPHRPYMRREDQRLANMTQAVDAIQRQVSTADTLFVDFQTNFLLRVYLCPEAGPGVFSASGFREYSCRGRRVISTSSETSILTADIFSRRWNDMVSTYNLKPSQTIWIFQAGWDIELATDLQDKVPEFRDLKSESFGRNISLFRLTTR